MDEKIDLMKRFIDLRSHQLFSTESELRSFVIDVLIADANDMSEAELEEWLEENEP